MSKGGARAVARTPSTAQQVEKSGQLVVIKNGEGKTVCRVDMARKLVEITRKGQRTQVRFLDDGCIETSNTRVSDEKLN